MIIAYNSWYTQWPFDIARTASLIVGIEHMEFTKGTLLEK